MTISFDAPGTENAVTLNITRPTIVRCKGCERRYGTDETAEDPATLNYWAAGDFSQVKAHRLLAHGGDLFCGTCIEKIYTCELCASAGVDDSMPMLTLGPQQQIIEDHTRKMCPTCVAKIRQHMVSCSNTECNKTYHRPPADQDLDLVTKWYEAYGFTVDEMSSDHLITTQDLALDEDITGRCNVCTTVGQCYFCTKTSARTQVYDVAGALGFNNLDEVTLCNACSLAHFQCACKRIVSLEFTTRASDGTLYCIDCVNVGPDGKVIYDPDGTYANAVVDISNFVAPVQTDARVDTGGIVVVNTYMNTRTATGLNLNAVPRARFFNNDDGDNDDGDYEEEDEEYYDAEEEYDEEDDIVYDEPTNTTPTATPAPALTGFGNLNNGY